MRNATGLSFQPNRTNGVQFATSRLNVGGVVGLGGGELCVQPINLVAKKVRRRRRRKRRRRRGRGGGTRDNG